MPEKATAPASSRSGRASVFVGSSSEGLEFARAVRALLEPDAEVTLWNEGVFELGQTSIESLVKALTRFDFAVLVLTSGDFVESGSARDFGPRDNVVFELGLFMGMIGRDRTFILHQRDSGLKIPSDLPGVTTAPYHWPRADGNHRAAMAAACDGLRNAMRSLGLLDRNRGAQLSSGLDFTRVQGQGGRDVDPCERL
jgi:predicted nucleotide-binding protein